MPFASVRGIDICYEIHGSGPRVVVISGTGGDLRQNPQRHRQPLVEGHEVLLYDQRGLGRSGKPDVEYSMGDYADDCAALMDELGWDRAHVVGISFGGMVAQHLALRHPERIGRLVLACTSSGGAGGDSFDLLAVADLPPAERAAIVMPIMDRRNDMTTDPPTLAPVFDMLMAAMGDGRPINADEPGSALGARRQLEARARHDVFDRLGEIVAPTFVIGGRYDGQAPPENVERLAAAIEGSRIEFFGGGHMFLLQDPSAWRSVIEFLDRVD
ncbi:MAG: alpha/beta hydrolase [Ilumatobacteraceae bacterium]|nr:alpha/beta hydrolase [Ilumatobacteraceae bacterium]